MIFRVLSILAHCTSDPNPLGITAASQVQSRQPQAYNIEGKGRVLFRSVALKYCSAGWTLPLERGIVHVLGYPGPGGGILLLLCPLLGPFINTDVPSPLTKIIHEKFNGTFLPPLSPSRFCCILDKLELHRGENKRAAQPLVLPASCCSAHFTWYKGHLA